MYGTTPHRFALALRLMLESPVSQALVCGRTWDDPAALRETDFLLGYDREAVRMHISWVRVKSLRAYKAAFKMQAAVESEYFGSESFQAKWDGGELKVR